MKKIINSLLAFLLVLFFTSCSNFEDSKLLDDNINLLKENIVNEDLIVSTNIDLDITEGEFCTPYTPRGEVVYDFNPLGDLPKIEEINSQFQTATFGLG